MKATARHYAESLVAAQEAGEKKPSELVAGFVGLMKKKRKLKMLQEVYNTLLEHEATKKNEITVTIETAQKPSALTQKKLLAEAEKMYPGKKVSAQYTVIPELVSGFRIRGKDRELDHSLSTKLKKLRNHIS